MLARNEWLYGTLEEFYKIEDERLEIKSADWLLPIRWDLPAVSTRTR
jgi:hypothetical protein